MLGVFDVVSFVFDVRCSVYYIAICTVDVDLYNAYIIQGIQCIINVLFVVACCCLGGVACIYESCLR